MKKTQIKTSEFQSLSRGYEQELKKEGKPELYLYEHTSYISELFAYAEQKEVLMLTSIDQSFIDQYLFYLENERINERRGGLLSKSTTDAHKNVIRNFWKYLEADGIKSNAINIKKSRKVERKLPTVLTHEEIQQLYAVTDDSPIGYRDRCSLALYYGCGMRKAEGLRLQIADIDFAKGMIHVRKTKTNRERYVMMAPTVQKQVEEYVYNYRDFYLAEGSSYEKLFIGERGTPIHSETLAKRLEVLWQRVKDRYGSEKKVGWHTLRHTLGTHLYMAGMSVEMVALMLGHRSLESTQLYIHSANELKR